MGNEEIDLNTYSITLPSEMTTAEARIHGIQELALSLALDAAKAHTDSFSVHDVNKAINNATILFDDLKGWGRRERTRLKKKEKKK